MRAFKGVRYAQNNTLGTLKKVVCECEAVFYLHAKSKLIKRCDDCTKYVRGHGAEAYKKYILTGVKKERKTYNTKKTDGRN